MEQPELPEPLSAAAERLMLISAPGSGWGRSWAELAQGTGLGANKENICSRTSTFLAFPVVLFKVASTLLKIDLLPKPTHTYFENTAWKAMRHLEHSSQFCIRVDFHKWFCISNRHSYSKNNQQQRYVVHSPLMSALLLWGKVNL